MNHSSLINKLSEREKIELMEELWSSLKEPEVEYHPPKWHHSELEKRRQNNLENKDAFSDWSSVKKEISDSIK